MNAKKTEEMDAKSTALMIARCENYPNEKCKGFLKFHDEKGKRHFPEPWNGNIETAKFLFISSNPSYDENEPYPDVNDPDDSIYDYFTNRFIKGKPTNKVKFWNTVDKWVHWINCIESGETDIEKINAYQKDKKKKNVSNFSEICLTEVCHCKSPRQKFVTKKCLSECVDEHKYLDAVLNCYQGTYVIVVGAVAKRYEEKIRNHDKTKKVIVLPHPNCRGVKDVEIIKSLIEKLNSI